jgi:uncharacterized protein YyaL (SSP411 family)/DNA-binding beta-propeller fold protein YncE
MTDPTRPANRLSQETSPYLLRHAHNPVDWYPWGPEALAKAKAEDRPILLSVGHAASQRCRVMARESFEDEATAAAMNAGFINIKVDRDERPDLDQLARRAVQAFTRGGGGWPMTVFLTPDGAPFLGGGYLPDTPRHGMPSFQQVLAHVSRMWTEGRRQVEQTAAELVSYLQDAGTLPSPAPEVATDALARLARGLESEFDPAHAGFGAAPKFPPHGSLEALLTHAALSGDATAAAMALETLDAMARGGMYDLLGGGFARCSVDAEWRIPHFEKMLYDNAQLVPVYVDAWLRTGEARHRRVVRETCDQVLHELRHPEGGFASALDADSEGEEGRFYAFTPRDLREALGMVDGLALAALCEVTDAGTLEPGMSVLRLQVARDDLPEEQRALVDRCFPVLRAWRDRRPGPGRDDKVITAWNALMIRALARAGAALGEERYLDAAEAAADFLFDQLIVDGRLQRTWRDGRAHVPAFADDHAALALALIDLYEATTDPHWLQEANGLANRIIELFWDAEGGGLFYTGHDAEPLVSRSKRVTTGAEPSANGLAALAFARLAVLCGRADLGEYADRILRHTLPLLDRAPLALGPELVAAAWRTGRTQELAIIGRRDDPRTAALLAEARRRHRPLLAVAVVEPDELGQAEALLPWLAGKRGGGTPTAYLCEGTSCRIPVHTPATLGRQLDADQPEARVGAVRDHAPALPTDPSAWIPQHAAVSKDELRGSVVVLDFWTSCCVNCLHVLPELDAIERRFADAPVRVIGVHTAKFPAERERAMIENAAARHGIAHPIVLDPDRSVWSAYTVQAWPTVMVLDTEGRIAWRQSGEVDRDTLGRVVQRLLDEGRAAGTLATAPGASPDAAAAPSTALRFPGKVSVWPPAAMQEQGADPLGGGGRLYVSDTGHHRILELALARDGEGWPTARLLRSIGAGEAGFADGASSEARLREPQGVDRTGTDLYIADTGNHAIRHVDLETGAVRTVAGTGRLGRGVPGSGRPTGTPLRSPWDVAAAGLEHGASRPGEDMVFIAMAGSHQLWALMPGQERLGPVAGSGREDHVDGPAGESALAQPSGLCLFGRFLFFADAEVSSVRFLDMQTRRVGTLVGAGLFDFGDRDGAGAAVRLQHALGLTAGGGAVWVADTYNGKIKRIDLDGGVTTTLATGLSEPGGITRAGDYLLVADTAAHRVVAVSQATGEVREVSLEGVQAPA